MWLFGLNAGKTHLVSFNLSNNNDTNDLKMDGSVFQENSFFKMLGLTFPSKLDSAYIISITKTASKNVKAFIHSMKFPSPEVALYL